MFWSSHYREDITRIDRLTFDHAHTFNCAGFGRAYFVLHLHGLNNHQALPALHHISHLDQRPDDLPRHWSHDLLAALGLGRTGTIFLECAGILNCRGILVSIRRDARSGADFVHLNFEGFAVDDDRVYARRDFERICLEFAAIDLPSRPLARVR